MSSHGNHIVHPLKEVDAAAEAWTTSTEQVVDILSTGARLIAGDIGRPVACIRREGKPLSNATAINKTPRSCAGGRFLLPRLSRLHHAGVADRSPA